VTYCCSSEMGQNGGGKQKKPTARPGVLGKIQTAHLPKRPKRNLTPGVRSAWRVGPQAYPATFRTWVHGGKSSAVRANSGP